MNFKQYYTVGSLADRMIRNSKTEDVEEPSPCFLQRLPLEVRVDIYKYLRNADCLRLRQVCHQTKQEIDAHKDFHIKIDQSYRSFRRLLSLRVNSCTIVRLTRKNLPKVGIFKHPLRVKELIFDGTISATNLRIILKQCTQVERLVFTHETLGIENLFSDRSILENLNQVTHVNLQLIRYPAPDPLYNRTDNMLAFLRTTFSKLTSFKLYFSVWGRWVDLFQFLQRHVANLSELELQVGDRCDARNTQFYLSRNPHSNAELLANIDMKILKQLKLKVFQFRDDVLSLNSTVSDIFINILKSQHALEIMHFHSPGDITVPHLEMIVKANKNTLQELAVYNVKNEVLVNLPLGAQIAIIAQVPWHPVVPPPILDMSIFSQCTKIRVLALCCASVSRHITIPPIKMINLEGIPVSIERFHTTGFTFLGDDIINLSRQSSSLKELVMIDVGSMKYSAVLSSVLRNCTALEYLSVRPVLPRANTDEAWWNEIHQLDAIYSRFMGVGYDPIDDLNGFEAHVTDSDRMWILQNLANPNVP